MKEGKLTPKPKVSNSLAQKELDKAENQLDQFNEEVKSLTLDRLNEAPVVEEEAQTKLSTRQIQNAKDIYLKPKRSIFSAPDPKTGHKEIFNEKFRDDYNYKREYVKFIAENREIIGETIQSLWTKPFPGIPAEEWDIPVNKPVWGPRYLADKIKRSRYHRMSMEDKVTISHDNTGSYYGQMVADSTIQRLDAYPVNDNKSVFMGVSNF